MGKLYWLAGLGEFWNTVTIHELHCIRMEYFSSIVFFDSLMEMKCV